jgi:hypothetical protein
MSASGSGPKFKEPGSPRLRMLDLIRRPVTPSSGRRGCGNLHQAPPEKKLTQRVVVSPSLETVRECHDLEPTLVLAALGGAKTRADARLTPRRLPARHRRDHNKLTRVRLPPSTPAA